MQPPDMTGWNSPPYLLLSLGSCLLHLVLMYVTNLSSTASQSCTTPPPVLETTRAVELMWSTLTSWGESTFISWGGRRRLNTSVVFLFPSALLGAKFVRHFERCTLHDHIWETTQQMTLGDLLSGRSTLTSKMMNHEDVLRQDTPHTYSTNYSGTDWQPVPRV